MIEGPIIIFTIKDNQTEPYLIDFQAEMLGNNRPVALIRFGIGTELPDPANKPIDPGKPEFIIIHDKGKVRLNKFFKADTVRCWSMPIVCYHDGSRSEYESQMWELFGELQFLCRSDHHNQGPVFDRFKRIAKFFTQNRKEDYYRELGDLINFCQLDERALKLKILHACLSPVSAGMLLKDPLLQPILRNDIREFVEYFNTTDKTLNSGPYHQKLLDLRKHLLGE